MRSIRLRRRPDTAPASPAASDSAPADGRQTATGDLGIPRKLLPEHHRHRVERPALARRLRSAAHPRFYAAQVGEPALADDVEAAITHFVASGLGDGARISGLFNVDVYRARLAERGLEITAGVDPFLHWLSVGWDERVVPTVLFDEEFYVARHPDVTSGPDWAFAQYLRAGCYAPGRSPTPFGPNYGGVPAPDARERQDPPLVTGLLHRAADYDLTRTSWLEEGVTAGVAKLARLDTERMRGLVAKAAAIEPLIAQTPRERWVSWPPHTHPMLMPAARAEEVRRGLGLVRADTVFVVPGGAPGPGLVAAAKALRDLEPEATVVVVTTDDPAPTQVDDRAVPVDLAAPWSGFTEARRLLGLLDVVRGLRPRRVVVAGSPVGWRLLAKHGTTLRHEMSLGAVLTAPSGPGEDDADGGDFQGCFDRLDWVVADTDAQRDDLTARYLLSTKARSRLLSATDCAAGALAAVAGERRA
ncbi:hypothetical protein SFC88_19925 [Nocardioides sp. HM23]|uniref:hypothetical protein n=1 Tax=Nocardioides bizhenqiangii TaxID=3095076 RepID=UPI002ACA2B82|nr:hypothetical protein [Nocardioides sp. HM23]MDZ5623118.1 hypothetical protein [Nocardioides sp. HM23]